MATCQECGLPIKACNAIAFYRDAVKEFERGKTERANELKIAAESCVRELTADFRHSSQSAKAG